MDPIDQLLNQLEAKPPETKLPDATQSEAVSSQPVQAMKAEMGDSQPPVIGLDDLLAQVGQPSGSHPLNIPAQRSPTADIDRLLESMQEQSFQPSSSNSFSDDFAISLDRFEMKPLAEDAVQKILGESKTLARSPEASLLSEIKTHYQQLAEAEEQERQQHLQAEKRRQEALRQQQQAALSAKANAWLKELDPLSGEGLWFEQFASRYPSKLEAAIDYLVALSSETTGGE